MAGTSCVKGTVEWFSQDGSTEMPPALSLPLLNGKHKGVETRGWSLLSLNHHGLNTGPENASPIRNMIYNVFDRGRISKTMAATGHQ